MTEEKKKELYDKFFEVSDGTSPIFFLKDPIKVKGTRDGMLDNIDALTSLIKDNNTWYHDVFDRGTTFDIRIIKYGDDEISGDIPESQPDRGIKKNISFEEVEEIPKEGVCLLHIQHGDINEMQ